MEYQHATNAFVVADRVQGIGISGRRRIANNVHWIGFGPGLRQNGVEPLHGLGREFR